MNLINRTDNLEIVFNSTNENRLFASVSAVDEDKSMMTISYNGMTVIIQTTRVQ